jgi:hypothetical protein
LFDSDKKTLDALDDKRHTLRDGCDSLAHGHYQIKNGYHRKYEKIMKPVRKERITYEQVQEVLQAIDDAPLQRMREIERRIRESASAPPKRKRVLMSMDEMRALR